MQLPPPATFVPVCAGVLLRVYELVVVDRPTMLADGVRDLIWSSLPFVVACGLAVFPKLTAAGAGFASASLLASLYAHYVLYQAPSPGLGTGPIVLLPLWCLILVGPLGALIAVLLQRRRSRGAV